MFWCAGYEESLYSQPAFLSRLESGRVFLYGYRMSEVEYVALPKSVKRDLKIGRSRSKRDDYNSNRVVMSTNLPLAFTGATPPRPDPGHTPSIVGGICKRFGYGCPKLNRKLKRRFRRFVQTWLKHNFIPLTDADIPSFEEWLEGTPYSSGRKDELRRVWEKFELAGRKTKEFSKVKSFIKDETYPEFKYPRIINSRIDAAKCYFGPVVQAVSDQLFSKPEFIKTVPVPDRPAVIRDTLLDSSSNEDYVFTDYTAFEAHFVPEVMQITQFELFRYALSGTACMKDWLATYENTMGGVNELTFKHLSAKLLATRMSGEMDTSLSNGFSNLMLFLFVAKMRGAHHVNGFVEGDDGLFRVTPSHAAPTESDFAELGFTIKIGHTKHLSQASFCGQVYDMSDLIVVTDPVEVIARLGWTNKKYVKANHHTRMQLLRARGYSLVYQYAGCPLLDVLGRRILQLTEGIMLDEKIFSNLDQWEAGKLRAAVTKLPNRKVVGDNTRALVQELYNVSIADQLRLEKEFESLELGMHAIPFDTPKSWKQYYNRYSLDYCNENPCWLNRDEEPYLSRLEQYPNCRAFVKSLAG